MINKPLDVLTIGNAIVDILAQADEDFIVKQNVIKGVMQLIDEERAEQLYKAMGPATIVSGGSAANTAVGIASLGGKASFIGKVKNDELGNIFSHDLKAIQVQFSTVQASNGPATARCFILVTPDGERTMNTYLGACHGLDENDISKEQIASTKIVYLEGYLWDPPKAKKAFRKAISYAHETQAQVALTLSDSFCVDRYRDEFIALLRDGSIDILFANMSELKSLYETSDENTAITALRNEGILGVITRSEEGALLVSREETKSVPAFPVKKVIDTTGAGDLFAAGFLAGYTKGLSAEESASLGALAAAEIISHMGPRPQQNLKDLAEQEGFKL